MERGGDGYGKRNNGYGNINDGVRNDTKEFVIARHEAICGVCIAEFASIRLLRASQ